MIKTQGKIEIKRNDEAHFKRLKELREMNIFGVCCDFACIKIPFYKIVYTC